MSHKSPTESTGTRLFALLVANCAAVRLLSSAHAQGQVQREANRIPSPVERRNNSKLNTSVAAAHANNCGLTSVLVHAGLHAGVRRRRTIAPSVHITDFNQEFQFIPDSLLRVNS